jgi:hypothetical protein
MYDWYVFSFSSLQNKFFIFIALHVFLHFRYHLYLSSVCFCFYKAAVVWAFIEFRKQDCFDRASLVNKYKYKPGGEDGWREGMG